MRSMNYEYTSCPACTYALAYADTSQFAWWPDIEARVTRNIARAGHLAPATGYGAVQVNGQPCDFCERNIIGGSTGWESV